MIEKAIVYTVNIGDSEDPYLMAGFPLMDWQNTEQGKFVMEHAVEQPVYYCKVSPEYLGYRVEVHARIAQKDLSLMYLKWGDPCQK